jgi:hypothetical protein
MPPVFFELGNLAHQASERQFDAMPVCEAPLEHEAVILVLGCLPAPLRRRPNLKGPDMIGANKC